MPIDPNIIAGLRTAPPIHAPDPLEQYGKSLTLQNLMRQGDAADRAEKRTATLQSLLATNPDEEGLRRAGFLDESLKVGKEGRERAKLDAETGKTNFETQIKKLEHGASLLDAAKDQSSWETVLRVGQITGTFGPEALAKFPKEYNPQVVEAIKNAGMTRAQQLTAQNAAAQTAETGRHNVATEGNAAGTLKVTQDRLAFDQAQPKGTYDAERGVMVNPRTNEASPVTMGGVPLGPKDKPLTESQGKASGLAMRAQKAHDILNTLEDEGSKTPSLIKQGVEGVPIIGGGLGMVANKFAASEAQQKVEQAQRDFVNAALRVESGASISESEFQNARRQYFAQPGDTPEAIAQKRRNRETEIESLKLQGGPGGKGIKSTYVEKPKGVDPTKLSDAELRRELGIPGG